MQLNTDNSVYLANSYFRTEVDYGNETVLDVEWEVLYDHTSTASPRITAPHCPNLPTITIEYDRVKGVLTEEEGVRRGDRLRALRDYLNGGPYPEFLVSRTRVATYCISFPAGGYVVIRMPMIYLCGSPLDQKRYKRDMVAFARDSMLLADLIEKPIQHKVRIESE